MRVLYTMRFIFLVNGNEQILAYLVENHKSSILLVFFYFTTNWAIWKLTGFLSWFFQKKDLFLIQVKSMFTQKPIQSGCMKLSKVNVWNEAEVKFSQTWSLLSRHIKMLETMYDKNEFLQLLEYFLFNIIMKQQKCKIMIVKKF